MWQVVKVAGTQLSVLISGLPHDLALVMQAHFEVGCMPGESVQIRLDPDRVLN